MEGADVSSSAGDAFASRMQSEYGQALDERHRLEEERVLAAQAAVRKELGKLKTHMKSLGKRDGEGRLATTYGALFLAVQGNMATLSGTLKTARRLKIGPTTKRWRCCSKEPVTTL